MSRLGSPEACSVLNGFLSRDAPMKNAEPARSSGRSLRLTTGLTSVAV